MMGVIVGTAEALGIAVDPDQPGSMTRYPTSCRVERRPLDIAAAINTRHIRIPWVLGICAARVTEAPNS